jgi:predicted DCC family thiol-disulfide oxidoreductase YuxK
MKRLYVLYDDQCGLCRWVRDWLSRQATYVPLAFLPLQSAGTVFPGIERLHPEEQLLTVSDTGAVWSGASAWIMVLWAVRATREWSLRLATPALRPFARAVCEGISERRYVISKWLLREETEDLRRKLARDEAEAKRRRDVCAREASVKMPPALPYRS